MFDSNFVSNIKLKTAISSDCSIRSRGTIDGAWVADYSQFEVIVLENRLARNMIV